ncbi:MgtC/SapB family protein [Parasphingopyxis lamellibrachiae]|nr:MgtC/SapB family protein [Parasphingopyxis lamellibrachiae]
MEAMFTPVSLGWGEMLTRLGAAALFSAALGIERYKNRKPVDFRPFLIIAVVSAALMIAITEFATTASDETFSIDPAKVFNGILTGIGFLGAGALFRDDNVVRGAGSAAAIWASGGIGIMCGLGYLWLAGVIAAGVVLLLLLSNDLADVHTAEQAPEGDEDD